MERYIATLIECNDSGNIQEKDIEIQPNQHIPLPANDAFPKEFYDRLKDINESYGQIFDPTSDFALEIGIANLDDTEHLYDMELSTYTSSLTTNPGNAAELAVHSLAVPHRKRIYGASMGLGGTAALTDDEIMYYAKSGRMTRGIGSDYRPLTTFAAMSRALTESGITVTRASSDSFGCCTTLGLLAALPEDQITNVYLKGRPNLSSHTLFSMAWRMLVRENKINNQRNKSNSNDPWKLTPEIIERVKRSIPTIYGDQPKQLKPIRKFSKQIDKYGAGMSRAGDGPYGNPHEDVVAVMTRQPHAQFTFDFPDKDLLYSSRQHIYDFIGYLAARGLSERVKILVTEGTHGGHTYEPLKRAAMEQFAFTI